MQRYQVMDGGACTKKIRAATWEIKISKAKRYNQKRELESCSLLPGNSANPTLAPA